MSEEGKPDGWVLFEGLWEQFNGPREGTAEEQAQADRVARWVAGFFEDEGIGLPPRQRARLTVTERELPWRTRGRFIRKLAERGLMATLQVNPRNPLWLEVDAIRTVPSETPAWRSLV